MATFAEKLHEVRRERNCTQEAIAKEMNVSRQTISHWENGRAVPDIDTIKQLSEVLEYNFFSAEEMPRQMPGEEAEKSDSQPKTVHRKGKTVWMAALGATALCAVLGIFLMMNKKPAQVSAAAFEAYTQEWFRQEQTPVAGQAFVEIRGKENPAPLISFEGFEGGMGWFYTFEMKAQTEIDFTVQEIEVVVFDDNGKADRQIQSADILKELYGSTVIDRRQVYEWMGGFPKQPNSAVGLLLKGVDAMGNALEFHGYIELAKEMAE